MPEKSASSKRNPFADLPVETFINILHSALGIDSADEFPFTGRSDELQGFRQVAKSWNSVIEAMPTVWTLLDCSDPPSWIIKSIDCANNSNLHIRYDEVSHATHQYSQFNDFMNLVMPEMDRWQSLFVIFNRPVDIPDALIHHSAPSLRSVVIRHEDSSSSMWLEPLENLFGGNTPRLVSMRIHSTPIRWNPLIFATTHLQRLEIHYPFDEEVLLSSFLNVLSYLTQLRYLTIDVIGGENDEEQSIKIKENSVILDQLVRLEWSDDVDIVKNALRALQYPTTCTVAIRCWSDYDSSPTAFDTVFSRLAPHIRRLHENKEEKMTLGLQGYGEMNITTWSRSLSLEFKGGVTLDWLIAMLQEHRKIFATIPLALLYNFAGPDDHIQSIATLLQTASFLPTISTLVIAGGDMFQILETLEAICGSTEGSPAFRQAFPALQSVEACGYFDDSCHSLIDHLDEFRMTQPTFQPPILRFPLLAGSEYTDRVGSFIERHPWAEWHAGQSATWEDFDDHGPTLVNGKLCVIYRPRPGEK